MNDTIIIENNSGFFAMIGKALRNRAFLGMLVILLSGWNFYRWWWQEDVCLQRYQHADKLFKKQNKRQNAGIEKGTKRQLKMDRADAKQRGGNLRDSNKVFDRYKGDWDGLIPKEVHGAIHKVK